MTSNQAQFRAMTEADASDWGIIADHMKGFMAELPQRIITHLELLRGDYGGYPVDRLEHCLQTATRALRRGMRGVRSAARYRRHVGAQQPCGRGGGDPGALCE